MVVSGIVGVIVGLRGLGKVAGGERRVQDEYTVATVG